MNASLGGILPSLNMDFSLEQASSCSLAKLIIMLDQPWSCPMLLGQSTAGATGRTVQIHVSM